MEDNTCTCNRREERVNINIIQTMKSSLSKLTLPTSCMEKKGSSLCHTLWVGGTYIRETGRTLKIRMSEHKRPIRVGDPHDAISIHVNNTGHTCVISNGTSLKSEAIYKEED